MKTLISIVWLQGLTQRVIYTMASDGVLSYDTMMTTLMEDEKGKSRIMNMYDETYESFLKGSVTKNGGKISLGGNYGVSKPRIMSHVLFYMFVSLKMGRNAPVVELILFSVNDGERKATKYDIKHDPSNSLIGSLADSDYDITNLVISDTCLDKIKPYFPRIHRFFTGFETGDSDRDDSGYLIPEKISFLEWTKDVVDRSFVEETGLIDDPVALGDMTAVDTNFGLESTLYTHNRHNTSLRTVLGISGCRIFQLNPYGSSYPDDATDLTHTSFSPVKVLLDDRGNLTAQFTWKVHSIVNILATTSSRTYETHESLASSLGITLYEVTTPFFV